MTTQPEGYTFDANWNGLYIGGDWLTPNRDTIQVRNPATGDVLTDVPAGTTEDVNRAYQAATAVQPDWDEKSPQKRAEVIRRSIGVLEDHSDEIVETVIAETGGTRLKADLEVTSITPSILEATSSFPQRAQGLHADSSVPGKENIVYRDAKGVVGCITPWNFPVNLTMRAIAPAIALGNAVVLKPSEETPISGGLLHARIFEEAGLPPGVLNVVPGHGKDAGARTASHPDADALSFTGSTKVGRKVAKNAVENLALPILELGGNNPHIVLEDANLERAVDGGVFGSFLHQGQVCISINRHLVHENVYDRYVRQLTERAADLTVGDPADPDTDIGPVINENQRDEMMSLVRQSVEDGATIETGGGYEVLFVKPTVLANVSNDMGIAHNEHFGPIAPVIPFSDDDDAVEIANETEYGLSGSVHSTDVERARRISRRIDTGMIHVNDQPINGETNIPFGGVKSSGLGRFRGEDIIRELTKQQWVSVQHDPRDYPL